ncbi:MAG: hypothetical protein AAF501_00980 [Pseudomonadota bacterium]
MRAIAQSAAQRKDRLGVRSAEVDNADAGEICAGYPVAAIDWGNQIELCQRVKTGTHLVIDMAMQVEV